MRPLTPKQAAFVVEYLKTPTDATRAAVAAGYSPKWADRQAHFLLHHTPHVAAAIRRAQADRVRRTNVTLDRTVFELARVGFSNIDKFVRLEGDRIETDLSTATEDDMAAVSEITQDVVAAGEDKTVVRTRIKLHPKVPALQELVKHLTLEAGKPTDRTDGQPRVLKDITDEQLLELMILRRQEQRLVGDESRDEDQEEEGVAGRGPETR